MFLKTVLLFLLICVGFAFVDSSFGNPQFVPKALTYYINWLGFLIFFGIFIYENIDFIKNRQISKSELIAPHRYKLLKITKFIFSTKTQKETFEQAMADWDFEIYEAIESKEIYRLLAIHIRCTYRFFLAIWLKSPIGDLIEFVVKIAKQ